MNYHHQLNHLLAVKCSNMYFAPITSLSARKSRDKFSDLVCHSHKFFKYCFPFYHTWNRNKYTCHRYMSTRLLPSNDAINNGVHTYPNGFLAPAFAVPVTHLITHIRRWKPTQIQNITKHRKTLQNGDKKDTSPFVATRISFYLLAVN